MIIEMPEGWKPIDDGRSDISGLDKRIKFVDDDSKLNGLGGGYAGMDHLDDSLDSEAAQHLIGAGRGKTIPPSYNPDTAFIQPTKLKFDKYRPQDPNLKKFNE